MIFADDGDIKCTLSFCFSNFKSKYVFLSHETDVFKNIEVMNKKNEFMDAVTEMCRFRQRVAEIFQRLNHFIGFIVSFNSFLFLVVD